MIDQELMVKSAADERYPVVVVCHGNICRSPMGEVLLREAIQRNQRLADRLSVSSAGVSAEESGNRIDTRARKALAAAGITDDPALGLVVTNHRASRLRDDQLMDGLILCMTTSQVRELSRRRDRIGGAATIRMWTDVAGDNPSAEEVDDPWYGDYSGFPRCLAHLQESVPEIVQWIASELES